MTEHEIVVAIAGTSGAGKSTLCRNLLETIPNSTLFELDMYEEIDGVCPSAREWKAHNFDPNMANLAQPANDLKMLMKGEAITYPLNQGTVEAAPVIIFDTPIGRIHQAFAPLINFVVLVDLPYEVALARRVKRIVERATSDNAAVERLRLFIPFYLEVGRLMYRRHQELVQESADVVIDGMKAPEALALEVSHLIQERRR
jgi:uridine kinase